MAILVFVDILFCWVPFVLDGFHDFTHRCPNCNAIIGKSTPDDREEEKKKGMRVVIGLLILGVIVSTAVLVLRFIA